MISVFSSMSNRHVGRGMSRLYSQSQTSRKISTGGNSILLKHPIPPTNTIVSTSTTRGYVRSKSTSKATNTATTSSSTTDTVGKVFFPSLCLLTFGLGSWQTRRYFEKVDMVKKREDDLELDPLSSFSDWQLLQKNSTTKDTDSDAKSKSYRRVNLQGKYQHNKQILIGPRGPPPGALAESGPNSGRSGGGMSSSTQGYWVITPLVIIDNDSKSAKDTNTTKTKREWLGRLVKRTTNRSIKRKEYTAKLEPQEETIVWVNRGWIPRHYINKSNQITTSWDEPSDIVQLVAMESNTETPGAYSPPSRLDTTKQSMMNNDNDNAPTFDKLLWMDRTAMEEITCTPSDIHPPLFVEINTDDKETAQQQFPVKPTREFVGEFKIPPSVHVGYAITWYGLSGAGMIMTRKLLTKGR